MDNKRSSKRVTLHSFNNFIKKIKLLKCFRITYQVVWNLVLIFFIIFTSVALFVSAAGAGYFASLVKDEPIRSKEEMIKDIYDYEEVSEIYFRDGQLLGEVRSDIQRREIKLDEVSEHLINAVIATEDEYFFEHNGIVPKAIMRATFQEFTNSSVQTGGSTLTQQLIKNQILTNEVSFERKAKEILLAMRLENFFDKEEILEAYLNIVPFGRNANGWNIAGVQSAAQGIFGVDAKDLNLPQSAYIAGLPQSPFGYTPFIRRDSKPTIKNDITPGLNRMKTVLTRMRDKGYITESEYKKALKYDILANLAEPTPESKEEYPYLTAEIINHRAVKIIADHLLEKDGIVLSEIEDSEERKSLQARYTALAGRDLKRNGYKIYTTIDKDIYDAHQVVAKNDALFPNTRNHANQKVEVGAVLIENKTGAIISFVGGRYLNEGEEFNRATQANRQNGSTMKPILAYAPAIELGLVQPGHIIPDTKYHYLAPPQQEVSNFDKDWAGLITVRESMVRSRNVPAVKSYNLVPREVSREKLHAMGIFEEPTEGASIGGNAGLTVEQNTAAYATFANSGNYIQSYMIEKVETKDGEVIYQHEAEPVEVFSAQTSYLITDMLRDVLKGGGTAAALPGMLKFNSDVAGKTGTTNGTRDSWFVGYNPNFTLGVWIGYDTEASLPTRFDGRGIGYFSQRIWAHLANSAFDVNPEFIAPKDPFKMPSGIVRQSFCGISGLLASDLCREAGFVRTDLFNAKFVPTKVDDSLERVKYVIVKGEPFIALDQTPSEFVRNGVSIKEEILEDEKVAEKLLEKFKDLIPSKEVENNGKTPSALTNVAISGNKLSWTEHNDNDIVGYRIYRAPNGSETFTTLRSVRSDEQFVFNVDKNPFAYYITAVDAAGRESKPSNIVTTGGWVKEIPKEEEKPDPKDNEEPKPPKIPKPPKPSNGDDDESGND
ncbi:transglycosylase domain-containing protein [Anaerobacillus sp. CMMVII]|uniref:transglycosylase domain-containing protein n=1 Tax=Anaerobacillus sp. CMMVII TaxID=2755588 RepID=UPI0021B73FEA|nr:transglycosylase domain-containing protein [Anaerobacillus sp. CMMVII]MCT8137356.1 transglycosylase domain-containing protein [Anaerobacillus sp. CMMVII]